MYKTIGFTGHRPNRYKYDLNDQFWRKVQTTLMVKLDHYIMQGYTTFISGLAMGFDTVAANCVISLRVDYPHIKLIGALPFPNQAILWSERDQRSYEYLTACCNKFIRISTKNPKNGIEANTMLQQRNKKIVETSDLIIALWDKMHYGGTFNTIQMAKEQNKPIDNIMDYL